MDVDPLAPVTALSGIGPGHGARLAALGVRRVQDLLLHMPSRYQDRRHIHPIGSLRPEAEVAVLGELAAVDVQKGRLQQLVAVLGDGTGRLNLRLFHFHPHLRGQWRPGRRLWCFGTVRAGRYGLEMVHPEWQLADGPDFRAPDHLTAFYPAVEGLSQPQLRRWMDQALQCLPCLTDHLAPYLPPQFPALASALLAIHQPQGEPPGPAHPAWQRLAMEELLAQHLAVRAVGEAERGRGAPVIAGNGALWERLKSGLPFTPTAAQRRVIGEIRSDLALERPMRRLLQGDVGSGKTLVACAAALHALEAGCQVAVMAPTEILAEQHRDRFGAWLEPLGITVCWLAQRQPAGERRETLERLAAGEPMLVAGTHALFQEEVRIPRLGLAIIDEQHRFGVEQRRLLQVKGGDPHLLVMTATPIPRTLAMTLHADLDLSVIDELPPGRSPVDTVVLPDDRRADVVARVRAAVTEGRQAYWVCPLIEESEQLQLQAAEKSFAELTAALPELRVGLVHGRLRGAEKGAVMAAFQRGEIQVLVATTVIEVGVDVPNASLMVVEHSERLGLAQLHQLRGRVGRGSRKSACVLLYQAPLSARARERLKVMRATQDGFEIARKDLELRGPGEFLGTRQTGLEALRVADLGRDGQLLEMVAGLAKDLTRRDPVACQALIDRWLGGRQAYGGVA